MPQQGPSTKRSQAARGGNRRTQPEPAPTSQPTRRTVVKSYRRSRSGCFTCRLRRKKCDEERPVCESCSKYGLRCEYKTPTWWASPELRDRQRDRIAERIRQHRVMEKEGSMRDYMARIKTLYRKAPPDITTGSETNQPLLGEPSSSGSNSNPYAEPLPTPVTASGPAPPNPFGIDSNPENQTSWPTMPMTSPYSATATTAGHANPLQPLPTPNLTSEDWFSSTPTQAAPNTLYPSQTQQLLQQQYGSVNPYAAGYGSNQPAPLSSCLESMIPISEADRPLLNHFVDHVIPLVFPISEALQTGPERFREVLGSIRTNRSYMHCCLSVSAIHLKTSMGMEDEMDFDIVKHRYEAICQLTKALDRSNSNQVQIMDASLAMIFYPCSVGTSDDYLTDIPWHGHFRVVSNLVRKQHSAPSKLNISLIAWIDILGATMRGETPQFAHTYRTKHLRGVSSGLQPLMGCDDRIMYLISEIACLESLKLEKQLDDLAIYQHVHALTAQLDWTEPIDPTLEAPFTPTGLVRPDLLLKIVSTLFRLAARIYLYSLLPNFDPYDASIVNLITSVTNTLKYIPAGAAGFDRALVWPLLIAGAHSIPSSLFRKTMSERVTALKYLGEMGSFGRMYRILKAVWRVADSAPSSPTSATFPPPTLSLEPAQPAQEPLPHWRDIMRQNKWDYLLM
ncbi:fungal-specific transcription factor domain-containing protein [Aspergillus karnatakaensis]|uniref:Zn(II)2Cys6 transcription factor n=1 Tax=Aspergillus karnatakaensis TaxID=1810916 RepID=UPI003CCDC7A0